MPYSSGLTRNVVQCLDDYGIPLLLSHTVVDIHGRERMEGVTVARVDAQRKPVPGTERRFDCDTLLLSVGLIPENEAARGRRRASPATAGPTVDESLQTDVPGVFACGNVLHVHDLVDHVTLEARRAGERAAAYAGTLNAQRAMPNAEVLSVRDGAGVRGAVPQAICVAHVASDVSLMFRPTAVFKDAAVVVRVDGEEILRKKCRILTPGEMVSLTLTKALLAQHAQGRELKVEVMP